MLNDSPTSGFPPYVIGPYKDYSTQAGENVAVVDLYCDRGMRAPERHARRRARRALAVPDGRLPVLRGLRADAVGRDREPLGRPRAHAGVGGRRPGRHVPSELHPPDHDPADHRPREHLGARRHAVHVVGRPALTRRGSPGLRGHALRATWTWRRRSRRRSRSGSGEPSPERRPTEPDDRPPTWKNRPRRACSDGSRPRLSGRRCCDAGRSRPPSRRPRGTRPGTRRSSGRSRR